MIADDEILNEFLQESQENLARLDEEMIELEKDPTSTKLLGSVFRTIHTIKGTCGFLGFERLETVSHRAENLLSEVRGGQQVLTPEIVSGILSAVDSIKAELSVIRDTGHESDATPDSLLALLASLSCANVAAGEQTTKEANGAGETNQESAASQTPPPSPAVTVQPTPVAKESPAVKAALTESPAPAPTNLVKAAPSTDPKPEHKSEPARSGSAASNVDNTVRLDVGFLDELVNLVGELALARHEIAKLSLKAGGPYQASSQRLNTITTELQTKVMRIRMQPVGSAWGKVPRIVRDLAKTCGKQIRLDMQGAETELDRAVVEAIRDPLIHIIRNSCDHGIESPQIRLERGKQPEGVLSLRAFHSNGQVQIEVSDDGGGIDPIRVKRKAISLGLIDERDAAVLSDKEAIKLICFPGFSTAETVTNISGRGVGMDVVKTSIEKIGGLLDLQSEPGHGTTMKIRIPLTLAIVPGLIVCGGGQRFILPQRNLIELIQFDKASKSSPVEVINGTSILHWRNQVLPLIDLRATLMLTKNRTQDQPFIAVLQGDEQSFGVLLEDIEDTQEIVIKPLDPGLKDLYCFAGASVLSDGDVCLILDVDGILKCAGLEPEAIQPVRAPENIREGRPSQMTLVCAVSESNYVALPLSFVDRLEHVSKTKIEHAGGRLVMQYRGRVLPLVQLGDLIGFGNDAEAEAGTFSMLVCKQGARAVGFVVRTILDIVDAYITPRPEDHTGISYPAIVAGRTVDVIDFGAVLELFDPNWFKSSEVASAPSLMSGELVNA